MSRRPRQRRSANKARREAKPGRVERAGEKPRAADERCAGARRQGPTRAGARREARPGAIDPPVAAPPDAGTRSAGSVGIDTSKRFGWEWSRYRRFFPHYERQFKGWIAPLAPAFLRGRDVLDAGCGMGRNSFWAARHGARSVVAVDHAEPALASAREVLSGVPGTRVERCDLYELGYEEAFDVVFSIGVVHHLEHPRRALERLVRALRPGGTLLVWVYGRDGLGPWVAFVRALLPALRRLPPCVVHTLAYAVSLPIWLGLRLPLRWSGYLGEVREFPFAHLHKIVFDQLLPEIARYYRRDELEALFAGLPLSHVAIHPNRGYSWTVVCKR